MRKARVFTLLLAFAFVFSTVAGTTLTGYGASVKAKSIAIEATANTVDIGGTISVSVKSVKPENASKSVTWKSSDKKIATVSSKGTVKGVKKGTVKITAYSKADKKVKQTIKIKVKDLKPTEVSLNRSRAVLYEKGIEMKLKASVAPVGLNNKGYVWASSDAAVAKVSSDGTVTPLKVGDAVITVKTKEGAKSAECKITVRESDCVDILKPYNMVGFYSEKKINYVDIGKAPNVKMWDAETDTYSYVEYNKENILGNYVQLKDLNADGKADLLEIVKFKDGEKKWDKNLEWIDGLGENTEPAVDNETGRAMFIDKEYRIPNGQRLLEGYGFGDWSGVTDFSKLDNSTYWTDYDYYNLKSDETLTILPQYKTQLQTTGWTCVLSSALSVLEWYGQRGDLNEEDLAALRSDTRKRMAGATSLKELDNVFKKLEELKLTCGWNIENSFDDADKIYDPAWLKGHLEAGHPVMVIWNSYGGHGQVIIGYDDMGTEVTSDDVLIMMDPYDTTDHNPDGYNIQSYERLIYGLSDYSADNISAVRYLVAYPKDGSGWSYTIDRTGKGLPDVASNVNKRNDDNKLNSKLFAKTAADLAKLYPIADNPDLADWIYLNEELGVGGPLGVENGPYNGDYNYSPYYKFFDFYNGEGPTDTLKILKNYRTIQQSTEWTCGCTSAVMVKEWFNMNGGDNPDTDISLSYKRQDKEAGATYLKGMKQLFDKKDWYVFTIEDLTDPDSEESYIGDYCLQAGTDPEWPGLIPYLIDKGIPMMIGWDEWGGHWQTIIGYDDLGTPGTQDDVIILADSYDTTDHSQDGYVIESFERLVYGWNVQFESWSEKWGSGQEYNDFIVAFPRTGYEKVAKELGLK